jgi:hypothetical protein
MDYVYRKLGFLAFTALRNIAGTVSMGAHRTGLRLGRIEGWAADRRNTYCKLVPKSG